MDIEVCEMRPDDFEGVAALWQKYCEGEFPGGGDEQSLRRFLARTRGLNLIAREDEMIHGFVICTQQNISGAICQAVIDETGDIQEMAKLLVGKSMQKLNRVAVGKCSIHLANKELEHDFWHLTQWCGDGTNRKTELQDATGDLDAAVDSEPVDDAKVQPAKASAA